MSNRETTLSWNRAEPITLPFSTKERRIAIRFLDWDRCKKKLRKIRQPIPRFHLFYSFLFGISASSGLSLVTLHLEPEASLPAWGYPLYWLLLLFSLLTAICFVYLDSRIRQQKQSEIDEILEDMDNIEKTFPELE